MGFELAEEKRAGKTGMAKYMKIKSGLEMTNILWHWMKYDLRI